MWHEFYECGATCLHCLPRVGKLGPGHRALGFDARFVRTWPQLSRCQRMDAAQQDIPAVHCGSSGLFCLLRGDQRQKRIRSRSAHIQLTPLQSCSSLVSRRKRGLHIRVADTEVERLPVDEQSGSTAPDGAAVITANNGPSHGRDSALWEECSKDVVPGGAIELGQPVYPREVGRSRKLNAGRGRIQFFLCDMNQRVVANRRLYYVSDCQLGRRCWCLCQSSPDPSAYYSARQKEARNKNSHALELGCWRMPIHWDILPTALRLFWKKVISITSTRYNDSTSTKTLMSGICKVLVPNFYRAIQLEEARVYGAGVYTRISATCDPCLLTATYNLSSSAEQTPLRAPLNVLT